MTEDKTTEDPKPAIKTLFNQLTTLITGYPKSGKDVMDAILLIGGWVSVIFASLIIMAEGENRLDKMLVVADKIAESLKRDIKKQVIILRGMKKIAKEHGIIVPEEKRIIT